MRQIKLLFIAILLVCPTSKISAQEKINITRLNSLVLFIDNIYTSNLF